MCVVSMVMDHYEPLIPRVVPTTFTPAIGFHTFDPHAELRKLIEDFKEAVAAARKVDALTKQPDCEDPEKAKLEERVTELERIVDGMRAALSPP